MLSLREQSVGPPGRLSTGEHDSSWWGDMAWTTPQYSRGRIDKSGVVLISPSASDFDKQEAMAVMGNWRSAHSYPLEVALRTLRRNVAAVDPRAIVAGRLKRFPAIALKLRREKMRLSQMQDIGGCRAVLRSIEEVRSILGTSKLWAESGDLREINYIQNPKETGYRSVHYVWKYAPKLEIRDGYDGMRVEIQIRSALQHAWATAVEMASTFKNEDLKFGQGDPNWIRFFALMGSAIAMEEATPLVPGTPHNKKELRRELRDLSENIGVEGQMKRWSEVTSIARDLPAPTGDARVFLVTLHPADYRWQVKVKAFRESETIRASEEYLQAEKESAERQNVQVALVSVESIDMLREAYPNYYQDTSKFLKALQTVLHATSAKPAVVHSHQRRKR